MLILIGLYIISPSQGFDENKFEILYSEIFVATLPSNIKYVATKFQDEGEIISCKYWTARILTSEDFYQDLLKEVKNKNEKNNTDELDEVTGMIIKNQFKSRFMSGYNYEIDFFNDNRTIRIYIIDCP